MNHDSYLKLEESIAAWCREQADIWAVIVIGSRGRQPPTHDAHSDLDLILFCRDASRYQDDNEWLNEFGEIWIAKLNFVGSGDPEWMAYYSPGLKADFLFVTAQAGLSLANMLDSLPYQQVLARGFRVLYQGDVVSNEPLDSSPRMVEIKLPTEWEFHQKMNAILFSAERFVKFSIRNDGWRSRYTFEAELMNQLLALIEWHAQSRPLPASDIWYDGRHIETWADKRIVKAVGRLHPTNGPRDQQSALLSFLDLFESLAGEAATQLGYEFPAEGQRKMIAWLKTAMQNTAG